MDTQGPILANFSKPSTNSDIILNIAQESALFISLQSFSLKAFLILSSSFCSTGPVFSFILFFVLVLRQQKIAYAIPKFRLINLIFLSLLANMSRKSAL